MKAIHAALFSALALVSFPGWAQSTGPTDPQIAAIVVTANQVDIDAGKLAESKTKSADVKAFAQRMVTDHSGVNQAAVDLVHKLGVTPQENPTSQSLKQGGDDNLTKLKALAEGEPVLALAVELEDDLRVPVDEVQSVIRGNTQTVCVFEDAVTPGVDQPTRGVEDHIRVLGASKDVHVVVRVDRHGADLTPLPAIRKLSPAVDQLILPFARIDHY